MGTTVQAADLYLGAGCSKIAAESRLIDGRTTGVEAPLPISLVESIGFDLEVRSDPATIPKEGPDGAGEVFHLPDCILACIRLFKPPACAKALEAV